MSYELIFTSAQRGWKPGSRGFCTVAVTDGIPPLLADRLESLSGYRPVIPASDPGAERNPVNYAHYRLTIGGKTSSVLSRVAFAGLDYTQRSNKLAHHLVIEPSEQAAGGPAWMLGQPGLLLQSWVDEPRQLPKNRPLPSGDEPPKVCAAWEHVAGDAGWAGVLAETLVADPSKISWLVVPLGLDVLPLIREAIALLPANRRWQATFSTYATELPGDIQCAWRCCVAGTAAASQAQKSATNSLVIDLTRPNPLDRSGGLIDAARSGQGSSAAAPQPASAGMFTELPSTAPPPKPTLKPSGASPAYEIEEPDLPHPPRRQEAGSRASSDRDVQRGMNPLLLAIAILWPIFAGVGYWFFTGLSAPAAVPRASGPDTMPAASIISQEELLASKETSQRISKDLDKAKEEIVVQKIAMEQVVSSYEARISDAWSWGSAEYARANEASDALQKNKRAAAQQSAEKPGETNPPQTKAISLHLNPTQGLRFIALPLTVKEAAAEQSWTTDWDYGVPENPEFCWADGKTGIIKPDAQSTVLLRVQWQNNAAVFTTTSTNLGRETQPEELARLTRVSANRWTWTPSPKLADHEAAYRQIRTLVLTANGKPPIQFIKPEMKPLDLTFKSSPLLAVSGIPALTLPLGLTSIDVVDSHSAWIETPPVADKKSGKIHFQRKIGPDTNIAFDLQWDAKTVELRNGWKDAAPPKRPDTLPTLQENVSGFQKRLQDFEEKRDRAKGEDRKSAEALVEGASNGLQTALGALNQVNNEVKAYDAFRDLGVINVRLRLENGCTVGFFTLELPKDPGK